MTIFSIQRAIDFHHLLYSPFCFCSAFGLDPSFYPVYVSLLCVLVLLLVNKLFLVVAFSLIGSCPSPSYPTAGRLKRFSEFLAVFDRCQALSSGQHYSPALKCPQTVSLSRGLYQPRGPAFNVILQPWTFCTDVSVSQDSPFAPEHVPDPGLTPTTLHSVSSPG